MGKYCLIALLALACCCQLAVVSARSGEDPWVWRTYSRRERAFHGKDIDRSASIRTTKKDLLRREPTTRRPLPGQPANDEIEDYVDEDPSVTETPASNVGTRQYSPYPGGNLFGGFGAGQPSNGGQYAGIGGYGGAGSPGVLVGPGGPTGIIGRPPPVYPNVYQPGYGGSQNGLGLPGGYPAGYGGAGGYPGLGAGGPGFPGLGAAAGYPGGQLGGAQFPGAGGQYPFGSYPGAGSNFNNNQFAPPGGQYPGLGQYPGQYGGPQYTEGYGLAGAGLGQPGLPPTGFGGNYGVGTLGYDEKASTLAEGKSAKSVSIQPTAVNDKLSKKI